MADSYVSISIVADDGAKPDLTDLKARLDELGSKVATARADVDDVQGDAVLTALQAKLDAVGKKIANPRIDMAGASQALAQVTSVAAALDKLAEKDAKAKAEVDAAQALAQTAALDAALDEFDAKTETAEVKV